MPKKFKFSLASVLRYRKLLKEQQEAKLLNAERAYQETESYIKDLDNKQHEVYISMAQNLESGFSLVDQLSQESFNKMVSHDQSKEKSRLARRKKAVEFEKTKYIKNSIDLKSMEKLEDKALKLHQKELLSAEMKQIDDLVNSRHRVQDL